jgi:hypothetical protein
MRYEGTRVCVDERSLAVLLSSDRLMKENQERALVMCTACTWPWILEMSLVFLVSV